MKEYSRLSLPPKEVLLKDDCKQMYSELKRKAPEITFSKLNLPNFEKEHIGRRTGMEEGDFYFNSKKEVDETVAELFKNDYNLHLMSRKSVLLDEDETFEEEIPMEKDLGMVKTEKGFKPSSIVSVVCKVLPWWERDKTSGLPFKVISFKLVLDQSERQMVLSDFWKV